MPENPSLKQLEFKTEDPLVDYLELLVFRGLVAGIETSEQLSFRVFPALKI